MAYWWASQNQAHRQERRGGYLWAPKSGASGTVFRHWSNINLVSPGDVIFSYAKQCIGAIALASSSAYDAPQPDDFKEVWDDDGRKVDVVYRTLSPAVRLTTFVDDLIPLLPLRNSPITRRRTGVQGYLFSISPKAGRLICDRLAIASAVEELITDAFTEAIPEKTTKDALVKAHRTGPLAQRFTEALVRQVRCHGIRGGSSSASFSHQAVADGLIYAIFPALRQSDGHRRR